MADNPKQSSFPDLYRLLALKPLESDRTVIEAALRRVASEARELKSSGSAGAAIAAKLFALGKQHLLSAERKELYDARWRQIHGAVPAVLAEVASGADVKSGEDLSEFSALLPDGDPRAAFDLQAYLDEPTSQPREDSQVAFNRIQAWFEAGNSPATTRSTGGTANSVASMPSVRQKSVTSESAAAAAIRDGGALPSLAHKLRKRRDRSLLLTAAGLLATVAALLAVMFYILNHETDRQATSVALDAERGGNPAEVPQVTEEPRPRGSGLPQVPGLAALTQQQSDASEAAVTIGTNQVQSNSPSPPSSTDADTQATSAGDGRTTVVTDRAEMMSLDSADSESIQASKSDASTSPPQPELTAEEVAVWDAMEAELRAALGGQDYGEAAKVLEQLSAVTRSEEQRRQLERLRKLHELSRDFHDALVAAITNMEAGETVTIGNSTPVSFVEGTSEHLVVRVRGENQRYRLTELPIGLAFGLADLELDVVHSSSLAKKAAFAMLHLSAKENELIQQRAKSMMTEAVAAGSVSADMLKLLDVAR